MSEYVQSHLKLVRRKVIEEGLVSCMNDSKWDKVFSEIQEKWTDWRYRQKSVVAADFIDSEASPKNWEGDWWYGLCNVEIEIMDIHCVIDSANGDTVDQTECLVSFLEKIKVPLERQEHFVRIRGYTRPRGA